MAAWLALSFTTLTLTQTDELKIVTLVFPAMQKVHAVFLPFLFLSWEPLICADGWMAQQDPYCGMTVVSDD